MAHTESTTPSFSAMKPPVPQTDPRRPTGDGHTSLLALPGMTLNSTIMPPFPWDWLSVDFTQFQPGLPDAAIDMSVYRQALADRLAAEPLWQRRRRIVVAHSFGGMLALDWLSESARVGIRAADAIVLVATTAGPMFDAVQIRLGTIAGKEIRVPFKPLMPVWNHSSVTRIVKRLTARSAGTEGRVDFTQVNPPSDVAVDVAGWRNTHWRSMRTYRLAMRGWDRRADLARLELPAVVLHGSEDTLFPISVAEDLARRLPRAELRIVESAGHVLPLTHGDHVIAAVEDVLCRLDR
jgi:pimeloyl-ACP methyl ester carboxylesterase